MRQMHLYSPSIEIHLSLVWQQKCLFICAWEFGVQTGVCLMCNHFNVHCLQIIWLNCCYWIKGQSLLRTKLLHYVKVEFMQTRVAGCYTFGHRAGLSQISLWLDVLCDLWLWHQNTFRTTAKLAICHFAIIQKAESNLVCDGTHIKICKIWDLLTGSINAFMGLAQITWGYWQRTHMAPIIYWCDRFVHAYLNAFMGV